MTCLRKMMIEQERSVIVTGQTLLRATKKKNSCDPLRCDPLRFKTKERDFQWSGINATVTDRRSDIRYVISIPFVNL